MSFGVGSLGRTQGSDSMSKNLLIFKGSPREKGNSTILADQAAAGATQAGAQVEVIRLGDLKIGPCTACEACHEPDGTPCIYDDDMQLLYPKLKAADAIVLASPVYYFTFSAQTKLLIDRWYALESKQGSALRGKPFGIVLTYGDSDEYTSGAINAIHTFQSIFNYMKSPIVGIVHGSASDEGDVLKKPELMEAAYQLGQQMAA